MTNLANYHVLCFRINFKRRVYDCSEGSRPKALIFSKVSRFFKVPRFFKVSKGWFLGCVESRKFNILMNCDRSCFCLLQKAKPSFRSHRSHCHHKTSNLNLSKAIKCKPDSPNADKRFTTHNRSYHGSLFGFLLNRKQCYE